MKKIDDGLTKDQRYRLKNLEAYRKRKAEYARTPEQREQRRKYMLKWRAENREKYNAARRDYHARNREKYNTAQKVWGILKYGITLDDLKEMLNTQNNSCAICDKKFKDGKYRSYHIDHDHNSGKVRSLLCVGCNTTLGKIELVGLDKFIGYLESHK